MDPSFRMNRHVILSWLHHLTVRFYLCSACFQRLSGVFCPFFFLLYSDFPPVFLFSSSACPVSIYWAQPSFHCPFTSSPVFFHLIPPAPFPLINPVCIWFQSSVQPLSGHLKSFPWALILNKTSPNNFPAWCLLHLGPPSLFQCEKKMLNLQG